MREWAEYWDIEPWGAWRDNFHAAVLSTVIATVNGAKDVHASDFFYESPSAREGQAQETQDFAVLAGLRALKAKAKAKRLVEEKRSGQSS